MFYLKCETLANGGKKIAVLDRLGMAVSVQVKESGQEPEMRMVCHFLLLLKKAK